jgi:hypothetical protein
MKRLHPPLVRPLEGGCGPFVVRMVGGAEGVGLKPDLRGCWRARGWLVGSGSPLSRG